jgi:hypothetical protein
MRTLHKWKKFANNLIPMWTLIEQHQDYSENDILQLHKLTAKFMDQWVDLCHGQHMTNYIHVIGAGHLTYFARHYGNLYRFSQQGWESLNKLIKHYYYNNTNHGGSYGNGGKDDNGKYSKGTITGQHCLPLMRFCQRFMMWKLGHGDRYFQNNQSASKVTQILVDLDGPIPIDESDNYDFEVGIL